MTTYLKYYLLLSLTFTVISCNKDLVDIEVPVKSTDNLLSGTDPVDNKTMETLEGLYTTDNADCIFGKDAVLTWSGEYLSCFSGKNSTYAILECGQKNSNIFFEGYWRNAEGYKTNVLSMTIYKEDGAEYLLKGLKPEVIRITCTSGTSKSAKQFSLTYSKPLPKRAGDFYIIGHRGGGRNSDRLPVSENSLEMIRYAERLGANAIEIDVQLTKDGVPVLFHDEYLTNRLVNETSFIGLLREYTFPILRSFCTLKNGEKIPTLEEALETAINKTTLKLVWLDIKGSGTIAAIEPIQKKYLDLAKQKGRNIEIMIGLPEVQYYNEYLKGENFDTNPTICELDEPYVKNARSGVWAPRWSLGLINDRVARMHHEGYRAFVWTLDAPELIKKFISKSRFDGVCTNYPSLVAYEYYTSE